MAHLSNDELRTLLDLHGWRVEPGTYDWLAHSPFCGWRRTTPDWALRPNIWGGPTYTALRQLQWSLYQGRRIYLGAREAGAPWVAVRQRELTNRAAIAYVSAYGKAALEQAMSEAADRPPR